MASTNGRKEMFTWIPSESGQLLLIIRVVDQLNIEATVEYKINEILAGYNFAKLILPCIFYVF